MGDSLLSATIQVFMKPPVPGFSKTRLIPEIGEEAAATIAVSLARDTLERVSTYEVVELWVTSAPDNQLIEAYSGLKVFRQPRGDLGSRMSFSLNQGLAQRPKVLLIGTDCPPIDAGYIDQAAMMLDHYDVVLGPAEDGGYGLIGVKDSVPDVFTNIDWGTDRVLAQTCRKLNELRTSYSLLPLIWDVDRPEDLPRYYAWLDEIEAAKAPGTT